MRSINKVFLIGRLGKDPEVQYLESGVPVAKFPLATSEVYKDKTGNKVEQTEWHNIVLWRSLAETAEKYLRKGSSIHLEGKIKSRSWDDKEGHKRYITEIIGDNFVMLDRKTDNNNSEEGKSASSTSVSNTGEDKADDLPF